MAKSTLHDEFEYYLAHQAELAVQYEGRYIVIKDQLVLGAYDDEIEAVRTTSQNHEMGTFLVQFCSADPKSTMQTYHSRAQFV